MRHYKKTIAVVVLMLLFFGIFIFSIMPEWDASLLSTIAIVVSLIFASLIPIYFVVEQDEKSMLQKSDEDLKKEKEAERRLNEAIERAFTKMQQKLLAQVSQERKKPNLYIVRSNKSKNPD